LNVQLISQLESLPVTMPLIQLLCFGLEQNLLGRRKRGLRRYLPPHILAAAWLNFRMERCRGILRTQTGIFHAAAVGDKDQIVFR